MNDEKNLTPELKTRITPGSSVVQVDSGTWRLQIPAGPAGKYRLAQLDDYEGLKRESLPWQAPCSLSLQARASTSETLPGTWGFGFWNDPFSLSLGLGGGSRRLPALPNTAWFFFASPPNYLSFRDDQPAQGELAATFRAPHWSPLLLVASGLLLPLAAIPAAARLLRGAARRFIQQDAARLPLDSGSWHGYRIDWRENEVCFSIDGGTVLKTSVAPLAPLGLVLWIDNQYAALPPDGRLRYGTLENRHGAWVEIREIMVSR